MPAIPASTTIESVNPKASVIGRGFVSAYTDNAGAELRDAEKKEIERLRSRHADYDENEEHWRFLLMAYEGGPRYVTDETLFRHSREHAQDFNDRKKRAHYQNFCAPIVDFVPEWIFKDPIDRQADASLKAQFDGFVLDVDRAGTNMTDFMRQVGEDARLFGKVFVQLDKVAPPDDTDPSELSERDVQELGVDIPYLVKVGPLEVLDWITDKFGNYVYIKRVEVTTEEFGETWVNVERYSEWTDDNVVVTYVDISQSDKPRIVKRISQPNGWDFVPFMAIFNKRSKENPEIGVSAIRDIAYQNRHVFNLSSLIDEFLYRQAFNILAIEQDTSLPTKGQADDAVGTSNVLEVPRQASHFPAYISPPVDPAQFIQTERKSLIESMYRQAAQDISSELYAGSNRSGDASKQAFGRTVPLIARLADTLQQAEERIMHAWSKMQGKQWKGKISYRDDYSITNTQDLLLQLTTVFNTLKLLSPTFVREEWKRIVREMDGRISQDQMEKIFKEIDDLDDETLTGYFDGSGDIKSTLGQPSAKQMMQGKMQESLGNDGKIAMATGKMGRATKEGVPDKNRRTSRPS